MRSTTSFIHVLIISSLSLLLFVLTHYFMVFSKPIDRTYEIKINNVGNYDFLADWDTCDYLDPNQLLTNKNDHDLLIMQWNTRGLRSKHGALIEFLNNKLEQKADIIMINETWLNNHSPPLPPIPGYKFVGKPRANRKGGGLGFLIRDDVIFRRKENLEINSKTFENIVIEIKCKTNLLLCSGYRPPNTDLPEFLTSYNKMVNNLEASKHSESIIGIDHNLDFIKQHLHNPTKMFIELNIDSNMLPTITRPTRITNTSATLIDNLFISKQLQTNYKSGILLDDTSDHMPCYLILPDATNHKKTLREVQHRNLSEKNKRKICDLIESIDWNTKLQTLDTNSAFDEFHNHLTMSIDSISPIVTKKINPKKQPRAKWITTGILNSINKNLLLYKESIKTNATPDQQL